MKSVWRFCCVCLLLLSIEYRGQEAKAGESNRPVYRHAYYLFLAGAPRGCEECYVPLLVSIEPLEQVAKVSAENTRCVLITTYERDSIWHHDGIVLVARTDVETATRMMQLRGRKYRYQEISAPEVLKLLMKPIGTIPISRPMLPRPDVPGPTLEELIDDFRKAK